MKLQFMIRILMESSKYFFSCHLKKKSELEEEHRKMIDGGWWYYEQYSENVSTERKPINLNSHIPAFHSSQFQRAMSSI